MSVTHGIKSSFCWSRSPCANAISHQIMPNKNQLHRKDMVNIMSVQSHFKSTNVVKTSCRKRPCSRIFVWATLQVPFLATKRAFLCTALNCGWRTSSAKRVSKKSSGIRPFLDNIALPCYGTSNSSALVRATRRIVKQNRSPSSDAHPMLSSVLPNHGRFSRPLIRRCDRRAQNPLSAPQLPTPITLKFDPLSLAGSLSFAEQGIPFTLSHAYAANKTKMLIVVYILGVVVYIRRVVFGEGAVLCPMAWRKGILLVSR